MRLPLPAWPLAAAGLLAGCALPARPQKPASSRPPGTWAEGPAVAAGKIPAAWWTLFRSPVLNGLEETALAASPTVAGAAAQLEEERALVDVAAAERSVAASLNPSAVRTRSSQTDAVPLAKYTNDRFRLPVDASYEVDAWNRVRNTIAAARADAAQSAADLASVRTTVAADVAVDYFQLRTLAVQETVLKRTQATRDEYALIEEKRFDAGLDNAIDLASARLEAANAAADLEAIEGEVATTRHALAVLCGRPPAEFALPPEGDIDAEPPAIPPGLPADLIRRRPDIAAADLAVDAAVARVGVARAAFFPQLTLTGEGGLESASFRNWLQSPSRIWTLGVSASLPLFDGGANRANYAVAAARLTEATSAYQSQVLTAFREVEDALASLRWLAGQSLQTAAALKEARDLALLARQRYEHGLDNYLATVDADRQELASELALAQLMGQRTTAVISLIKALGGGWAPEKNQFVEKP